MRLPLNLGLLARPIKLPHVVGDLLSIGGF